MTEAAPTDVEEERRLFYVGVTRARAAVSVQAAPQGDARRGDAARADARREEHRRHWDALTRFIDNAQVPIDNSPTEHEFQNFAKLRLDMLFAGSTEGAHRACVLLGNVATCRAVSVPVQAYLAWAFRVDVEREAREELAHGRSLRARATA